MVLRLQAGVRLQGRKETVSRCRLPCSWHRPATPPTALSLVPQGCSMSGPTPSSSGRPPAPSCLRPLPQRRVGEQVTSCHHYCHLEPSRTVDFAHCCQMLCHQKAHHNMLPPRKEGGHAPDWHQPPGADPHLEAAHLSSHWVRGPGLCVMLCEHKGSKGQGHRVTGSFCPQRGSQGGLQGLARGESHCQASPRW